MKNYERTVSVSELNLLVKFILCVTNIIKEGIKIECGEYFNYQNSKIQQICVFFFDLFAQKMQIVYN